MTPIRESGPPPWTPDLSARDALLHHVQWLARKCRTEGVRAGQEYIGVVGDLLAFLASAIEDSRDETKLLYVVATFAQRRAESRVLTRIRPSWGRPRGAG